MHIEWKCIKCNEKHTSYIDNINIENKEIFELKCSTCSTVSLYKIISLKHLANCSISNSETKSSEKQIITFWD